MTEPCPNCELRIEHALEQARQTNALRVQIYELGKALSAIAGWKDPGPYFPETWWLPRQRVLDLVKEKQ